ncbi:MAG: 30S ribosomal protein S6 [Actinomycetota bacterium]
MREYELLVLIDPDAEEQQINGVAERIGEILSSAGGEVEKTDHWGRRKLAFEIDHKAEGYYMLVTCRAEQDSLAELDRVLSLADEVLRFKIVRKAA